MWFPDPELDAALARASEQPDWLTRPTETELLLSHDSAPSSRHLPRQSPVKAPSFKIANFPNNRSILLPPPPFSSLWSSDPKVPSHITCFLRLSSALFRPSNMSHYGDRVHREREQNLQQLRDPHYHQICRVLGQCQTVSYKHERRTYFPSLQRTNAQLYCSLATYFGKDRYSSPRVY